MGEIMKLNLLASEIHLLLLSSGLKSMGMRSCSEVHQGRVCHLEVFEGAGLSVVGCAVAVG